MQAHILEQPRSHRVHTAASHSILIIEDDAGAAEALERRLTSQGYDVRTAATGNQGLLLAKTDRPDLVILDLGLPDVDGFTVCQDLADSPETCGIPVIVLSGMARPDVIRRSRAAGCQFYVRKPYDPSALLILVERAIEESRAWLTADAE